MNFTVPIAMFGWPLVSLLLFALLPARTAVLITLLGGWLLLPNAGYLAPVIREYDKSLATTIGVVLGTLLFEWRRVENFRFTLLDIPMCMWCFCPLASSISNGLGVYDGLADSMGQITMYGLPYLIGRVYCRDDADAKAFVIALFVAGVALVPFCIVEMWKGPFFHAKVYGFLAHNYWEELKAGGWRPMVFFVHGLWLGGFLAYASGAAVCISFGRLFPKRKAVPVLVCAGALVATLLSCRSQGAISIFALAMVVVAAAKWRSPVMARAAIMCFLLIAPLYVTLRISGLWSGAGLVDTAREVFGGSPAGSLNTRIELEDKIIKRALEQPLFGWGGYGRSLKAEDDQGVWTEGIWTKAIGEKGVFGLGAWLAAGVVPAWWLAKRISRKRPLQEKDWVLLAIICIVGMQLIYGITVLDFSPINPVFLGVASSVGAISVAIGKKGKRRRPYSPFECSRDPIIGKRLVPKNVDCHANSLLDLRQIQSS